MNLLILGGTYFLGKAFTQLCDDGTNRILLVNRGSRQIDWGNHSGVKNFRMDRHDPEKLRELKAFLEGSVVDAVVDFCAYEEGDIRTVTGILPEGTKQYIFVSTCDVYRRGTGKAVDETGEMETRDFGGQEGAYILGKVALEKELRECALAKGMHFTSYRPAIIYGPGNYAPREGLFFHWIANAGQILFPEDADGSFQMVYVKDLAKMIRAGLLREDCYDRSLNVCGEACLTYQSFAECLEKACLQRVERISIRVSDLLERGIQLPFPLRKEESECYSGELVKQFGIPYTPLEIGLKESYEEFLRAEERGR